MTSEEQIQKALGTVPIFILEFFGPRGGRIGRNGYEITALTIKEAIYNAYHFELPLCIRKRLQKSHESCYEKFHWERYSCAVWVRKNWDEGHEKCIDLIDLFDKNGNFKNVKLEDIFKR